MPPEDWSENIYLVHMADDPTFGEEMESLLRQSRDDPRHVVLDLATVTFMNSSNLSQLMGVLTCLGKRNQRCTPESDVGSLTFDDCPQYPTLSAARRHEQVESSSIGEAFRPRRRLETLN